ncbi:MAG TPA: hypothetical protein VKU39_20635 [Streptosporangiaceae bacterium]|nr:hypothetical protein [Streptosporangiaceae bacterium]
MEDDRPWPEPAEHLLLTRRWKYAPPPWVMYEAIVNDGTEWLRAVGGESQPVVVASRRPDAVLLRPWLDSAVTAVELGLQPDGHGAAMTVLAYGAAPLPDEVRRRIRHRLGVVFGEMLRRWVDEPR